MGQTVIDKKLIGLKSESTSTVAHELLHAFNDLNGLDAKKFNDSWDELMNRQAGKWEYKEAMQAVDTIIFTSPLYVNAREDSIATERFAYFGQVFGRAKLNEIPPELRPYYKDIINK
jgi:hypothetical protein